MPTDASDFEKTALPHLNAVFRTAVALCGDPNDAEDLVQDTFTKAIQRFDSFKTATNCKAWLLQILRNTWIDRLRHKKVAGPMVSLDENLVDTQTHPAETTWSDAEDLLRSFSDQQVITALAQLPEDRRLVLFLSDVEQLPLNDIAGITSVPLGTVKSRLSRARCQLKTVLAEYAKQMGFTGDRT